MIRGERLFQTFAKYKNLRKFIIEDSLRQDQGEYARYPFKNLVLYSIMTFHFKDIVHGTQKS